VELYFCSVSIWRKQKQFRVPRHKRSREKEARVENKNDQEQDRIAPERSERVYEHTHLINLLLSVNAYVHEMILL